MKVYLCKINEMMKIKVKVKNGGKTFVILTGPANKLSCSLSKILTSVDINIYTLDDQF